MLIAPDHIYSGGRLTTGMEALVEDGRISLRARGDRTPDARPRVLMPACTDLQVNGGGGRMVNGAPDAGTLRHIAAAHRVLGTGWILPTVITDAPEVIDAAADAAIEAHGADGVLGLHIEGPHINPARRGTHKAAFVRPLDRRTVATVTRLRAAGVPTLLTLAPELAVPSLLAALRDTGCVLSAGHSAATAEQTRVALAAGVGCFTHLYNAMPPMTSRAPGIVGTAILSNAFRGLIADGIHVSWEMLRIACAVAPPGRGFLVSDAMATVGGPDHFTLYGDRIEVRDGALVNAEGALAGAHLDMVTALANMHAHVGLSLADCIAMATDTPRAVLGLPPQSLDGAPLTDAIALDADLTLQRLPG